MSQDNIFDQLSTGIDVAAAQQQEKELRAKYEARDHLIHKVFKQSKLGAELLEIWVNDGLIMAPTARRGDDLLSVGMEEGKKEFIRNIVLTIKKVEGMSNE